MTLHGRLAKTSGILALAALLACPAQAQVASVTAGAQVGHGYMVRSAGTCYVLLPRHVAAGERLVTLRTAAPVAVGQAWVETPFWEGLDLAIGVVRGDATRRCDVRASELVQGATTRLRDGALELVRLRASGEVERLPMRVSQTHYLTFDATLTQPGAELYQGTSGALVFAGGVPVGMAIEAPTPTEGRFVHMEEIHLNTARWLARRSGAFAADTRPAPTVQPAGFAVELVEASAPAISAEHSAERLLGDGAYVFQPQGPNRLLFRVTGDAAVTVSQVSLQSQPDAGHALPRDIRVDVSSRHEPGPPYRFFASGQMGPDGKFEQKRSPTMARWIQVTIESAWSEGAVRVDGVGFE